MQTNPRRIVTGLFLLSGFTGLVYESVWIRLFALNFGSTAQALSTVAGVYLGGLAIGALLAERMGSARPGRGLEWYGVAEILTGVYALAIPWLVESATPWLAAVYAPGKFAMVGLLRAICCAVILAPATIFMGATLPLLANWARSNDRIGWLYAVNLIGAATGALLSGFTLLPALGFARTMQMACVLNVAIGVGAITMARRNPETPAAAQPKVSQPLDVRWRAAAFLSGFTFMLYEVVWSRIAGLLFGPTASTITLVLAAFLAGLAISAFIALRIARNFEIWLCAAQAGSLVLLLWAFVGTGLAPGFIANWVRSHSDQPGQIELLKIGFLAVSVTPLAVAAGLIFPIVLRLSTGNSLASSVGGLYGINVAGCILGSILTGWLLIPVLGTQATVLAGGVISAILGLVFLLHLRPRWRFPSLAVSGLAIIAAVFLVPAWKMDAMTAGGYKYALYSDAGAPLSEGALTFLREGPSGTVAVRKSGGSTILSIDGKVDATDAGGDLLTEKLLAHLPLLLSGKREPVCLIGLASGVTAGAVLTYPVERLDVLELSKEVETASHFFNHANGRPLEDSRTRLLVNDGRNHLLLTRERYGVIISEPSNPWIAGMNSLFTRDFFEIAKSRLRPGGLFAQWFHIYNMPADDLRSLLSAFHHVFPNAALWRMNDGDVLLTGFAGNASWPASFATLPTAARTDLAHAGVVDPEFLWNMYVMQDSDIEMFAAGALPNTDDHPWLEFHGQRDLHTQTDMANADALETFPRKLPLPDAVARAREHPTATRILAYAKMFERAESYRSAYRSYFIARSLDPASMEALAGMDRCARRPEELLVVSRALSLPAGTPSSSQERVELAVQRARNGDASGARFLFAETIAAHPADPAGPFNLGVFNLEQGETSRAIEMFEKTISLDPSHIPAHEAIAEAYLKRHDYRAAADWSRRILKLDPNHSTARHILAALERESRK